MEKEKQKTKRKLTAKQKRFAEKIVEKRKNLEPKYKAAEEVFDIRDPEKNNHEVARSMATEYLAKPHIRQYIMDIAEEEGLTHRLVIKKILEGMDASRQVTVVTKIVKDLLKRAGITDFPETVDVPDLPTRLGYLKMAADILDMFPANKVKVEGAVGHVWIEELKKGLQIDAQSLSRIGDVGVGDVSEEALPVPKTDSPQDS